MGRKRASMKLIQGKKAKDKIYKDRGKTLKRKAEELSTLCGMDVCLIIVPAGENAAAETWPKDPQQIDALIDTFQTTRENDQKRCKVKTVSDSIQEWIQDKEVELARLRKMNLEARFPTSAEVFQGLPKESRGEVATFLAAKIEALKQKINDISLTNASTSNSTDNLLDLVQAGGEGYYSLASNDGHGIQQNAMHYDAMYYDSVALSNQFPQSMTSLPDQYMAYGYYNAQAMPRMEECLPEEVNDLRWEEHAGQFSNSHVFQVPKLEHPSTSDVFQVPQMEHPPVSHVFQVANMEHPYFHMERGEFCK